MKSQSQKNNPESKPKVTINLSPLLESYCRWVFNTPENSECITIKRNHEIGKLIHGHIQTSELPVKRPSIQHPVTFILPVTENNNYAARYHFLYVDKWGEEKINDTLEAWFKLWINLRFQTGYKKGKSQKQIIEAILRGLNVRNNSANFDAIKKIDYRTKRKEEEMRFVELLED